MRKLPLHFVLLCVFAWPAFVSAQQKAELFDEMSSLNCELLWSRLDGLMAEVGKNPDTTAVVEISGKSDDQPHTDFYWYEMIRGYFLRRQLSSERLEIRRTARIKERRARFWIIPPGGSKPEVEESEWSFVYPEATRPFILTNGENYSVYGNGTCLDVDEYDLLARALAANPRARTNVVLITPTERLYRQREKTTRRLLTKDYGIAASQIRFFRKYGNPKRGYPEPDAEYWFVPGKSATGGGAR